MSRGQGVAPAQVEDRRPLVATLGDVLPVGEVRGRFGLRLGGGASEDQAANGRSRAEQREDREQAGREQPEPKDAMGRD